MDKSLKKGAASKFISKAWSGYSFIFVFFIVLIIYAMVIINKGYAFNWDYIAAILSSTTCAVVGIMALGMALVIITGQIDLSLGSMCVLVGSFAVITFNVTDNILLTILFAIAAGAICGFINGVLVGKAKMPSFIVTLGTMLIFRSLAEYYVSVLSIDITGSTYKYQLNSSNMSYDFIREIGTGKIDLFGCITIPYDTIILLVFVAIMIYISKCTKFGKSVYAVGSNEKAAHLAAINVDAIRISVFVIAGALTGISSLLLAWKNTSITPASTAMSFEMYAIAAVVLGGVVMAGGRGKIIGVFFGALSYAAVDKIISASGLDIYIQDAFQGIVLLLVVLIQTIGPVIGGKVKMWQHAKANAKLSIE